MEKYEILSKVGEGSFGQVFKAKRRVDGEIVAFKIIRKSGKSAEELKSLRRECEIQQYLYHPNIIKMLDSFETDNEVVVVTEYANKVLNEILAKAGRLSEERVQVVTCDLVSALYYLHSNRILHRDLKPQNVLLDANGVAKLCDFGFARSMSSGMRVLTSIKGTPLYMAPELIEEFPYDYNVDLWSLGCIIYELITGIPPFPTSSLVQLYNLIRHETIKWPNYISSNCKNFLQGLLQKNPLQRLTWPDLLYHPFVRDRVLIMEKNSPLLIKNLPSFSQDYISSFKNQDKNHQEKGGHNVCNLEVCCNICVNSKCSNANFTSSADGFNHKTKLCKDTSKSESSTKQTYNPNKVYLKSSTEQSSSLKISTDTSNTKSQVMEQENSSQKFVEEPELELGTVDQSIENEEWLAFLQRSMEEIMNGEIESLLQDNCITIFVSPLRNPAANCRVIEYISNLLSLPFVVSIKKDDMESIQKVYIQTKVVPNLIYAMKILMTDFKGKETLSSKSSKNSESTSVLLTDKLQALESTVVLLCRLLYTQEEFVKQFCSTVHIINELQLFKSLFNLEKRKSRVVADFIGILIKVLQTKAESSQIVEKILLEYESSELIDLLMKLMNHRQSSLRLRVCTLISLLGESKSSMLQKTWGRSLRNQLETLADDDDDSIKNAAENAISEMKQLPYYDQHLEID